MNKQKTSIIFSPNTNLEEKEPIVDFTNGVLCGNYNRYGDEFNSQTPWCQIFKSKYFKNCDVLESKPGYSPSHVWRSIWSSISLVKAGAVWRFGKGHTIKVWHGKWIPQPISYKVQSPINQLNDDSTVAELIDEATCRWKTNLVGAVFNSEEAQLICNIPLNMRNISDRLIWARNTKGIFTIKSSYFLDYVLTKQSRGESSNAEATDVVWRKMWKLHVPGKIKQFLWKALNDILPTRQMLRKKHIVDEDWCPMCKRVEESVIHVLWNCPASMDGPSTLLRSALSDIEVFHDLYQCSIPIADRLPQQVSVIRWNPPTEPFCKLNFDGAYDAEGSLMGLGIVVRNFRGEVEIVVSAPRSYYVCSAFTVECYALMSGIQLCLEMNMHQVLFEHDAKQVIDGVKGCNSDLSWEGQLIDDIQVLMSAQARWDTCFVRRDGNKAAHMAAKLGLYLESESVWIEDGPQEVMSVIQFDKSCIP
ncbi:hypothetical protein F2P56_002053 [Juglans regia]|uniref:Uncharacterized protein LOC108993664 n=2 Tax=Juglans regia TaxID=51240 RepID=A0A2I4EXS1_JUGRE|nr:uncharacterized protein LOC108993664 [Juglans regia]KAF5481399.1 hypothetical protein F2P56_002053 [Juglans regia]